MNLSSIDVHGGGNIFLSVLGFYLGLLLSVFTAQGIPPGHP